MRYKLTAGLIVAVSAVAAVYLWHERREQAPSDDAASEAVSVVGEVTESGRYILNITLHSKDEIAGLLARAEQLAAAKPKAASDTGIALVLHGPEIRFFVKNDYDKNRGIVDLARRLDKQGVMEIKMCRTAMRHLGVKEDEIPDFVEFVPFAPDEIKRLQQEGYVLL